MLKNRSLVKAVVGVNEGSMNEVSFKEDFSLA